LEFRIARDLSEEFHPSRYPPRAARKYRSSIDAFRESRFRFFRVTDRRRTIRADFPFIPFYNEKASVCDKDVSLESRGDRCSQLTWSGASFSFLRLNGKREHRARARA